jgi:two-component system sensor histidine kinase DesK
MSVVTNSAAGHPLRTVRRARWFLVALHVLAVAIAPVNAITGFVGQPRNPAAPVLAALAIGGLQLRHTFAAARGERPRGWQWTGLALAVLVYLPMVWFTWNWAAMQWFVIASALMLLRGWPAAIAATVPILATSIVSGVAAAQVDASAATVAYLAAYWLVGLVIGALGLYGAARLVRVLDDLHATRAALAELAVGRERLRVSRDLHDLLGQSLSAVSLKGDLAVRLLRDDPPAARAEIEGLTGVARDALRGVRAVTRDEHAVSVSTEAGEAAALLSAAGIDARIDLDLPGLVPEVENVLAWAVREGVTNVLRHSEAGTCSITAGRRGGAVWLQVVNDGARTPAGDGTGLVGLAGRARALSGSASAERTPDGRFKLLVEVPEEGRAT